MTCDACVKHVSSSLSELQGIVKVNVDLKSQIVSVEGNAAPSAIVKAIQATGRDAILRGSGTADSAAVCILETHSTSVSDYVRGLVRMVQVAPALTLFDITIRGLSPGTYHTTIRESGDIRNGPESAGSIWEWGLWQREKKEPKAIRGVLGTVEVGVGGSGSLFLDKPIQIWEMIGRSMIVSRQNSMQGGSGQDGFSKHDPDTLVGVIARSAGVWDNDRTVCSCSGKTVWEERREQSDRGML
ncbi:MAG: hypothetical protein Q9162_004424 [Coniocarpon cinnabarinum]